MKIETMGNKVKRPSAIGGLFWIGASIAGLSLYLYCFTELANQRLKAYTEHQIEKSLSALEKKAQPIGLSKDNLIDQDKNGKYEIITIRDQQYQLRWDEENNKATLAPTTNTLTNKLYQK